MQIIEAIGTAKRLDWSCLLYVEKGKIIMEETYYDNGMVFSFDYPWGIPFKFSPDFTYTLFLDL